MLAGGASAGGGGCGSAIRLRYVWETPALWWRGRYNLVLTKAAFLHADHLSLYTHGELLHDCAASTPRAPL